MKEEFYKQFIDLHKKCGQGMSGIVKVQSSTFERYLDELIEEGLVKACHTGNSIGHPESNIFYMPTKGYNVWEDEGTDGQYSRHKGKYLPFVRLYLGAMEKEHPEGTDQTARFINPSMVDCLKSSELMADYAEWLKRNEASLKEMTELDTFYKATKVEFSKEELDWIKNKTWYTKNKTLKEFIELSMENMSLCEQILAQLNRMLSLCQNESDKFQDKITETTSEIKSIEKEILICKKIIHWADSLNQKTKIQELL